MRIDGAEAVQRLEALELGAASGDALYPDLGVGVDVDRQIGGDGVAVDADDPGGVEALSGLLGDGGEDVAVREEPAASIERRFDALGPLEVVDAVGGEEQGKRRRVEVGLPAQHLADEAANRAVGGLARRRRIDAQAAKVVRQQFDLSRGAGAVKAFEDDEFAAGQRHSGSLR